MSIFIQPDWPAPANVKALSTTRKGGISEGVYSGLNLGLHVQDAPSTVLKNRQLLNVAAHLPNEPLWLNQIHSTEVVAINTAEAQSEIPSADASYTRLQNQVSIVMTADCLPLLVCDKAGTVVAAIHAGWRGLLDGIIEKTLKQMQVLPSELLVWLGPAISQAHFEVGDEVRSAFVAHDPQAISAFKIHGDKWLADLYALARLRLSAAGVNAADIYGGEHCTYQQRELFYSYRRDCDTGRQASLIYLES